MTDLPFLRDLVVLLLLSLVIVLIFQRLRLPPIVGFLAAGVVLGPHGLALIPDVREVERLAEVGVILLLFTLGLEFSLAALVQLRREVLLGGGLQVGITLLVASSVALGFAGWRAAVVIGGLVALSSTVLGLKLLLERGEIDAPHGRAALGILLLQDLLVIPMMLAVPILAGVTRLDVTPAVGAFLATLLLVAFLFAAARWLVPRLLAEVVRTRHRELFVLTLVLICLGTAWATSRAGLSLALGAFLAGVVVSESEYGAQALADVLPLRDTFSSLFFISIGMLLEPGFVARQPLLLAGAVLAVLALKLLTGVAAVSALGLGLRTAVRAGFATAQVGEFSFLLAQAAVVHGLLDTGLYQLFLAAAVATMFATPFLFTAAGAVADRLPAAGLIATREVDQGSASAEGVPPGDHVVIGGYGVNGRNLARVLRAVEIPYVIADINPERIWGARAAGEPVVYADVTRLDALERCGLERARAFVLALSDPPSSRRAVTIARARWSHLVIIVRTRYVGEVEHLLRLGATEVVPEELETSVEIFAKVLATYGVPRSLIAEQVDRVRREHYALWREGSPRTFGVTRPPAMSAGPDIGTYRVIQTSAARGKTLAELDLPRVAGANVVARVRDGEVVTNPGGDVTTEPGDVLVLLGTNDQLARALRVLDSG
jgi:CPA2 family monovalent cation:H+ antiporter-2